MKQLTKFLISLLIFSLSYWTYANTDENREITLAETFIFFAKQYRNEVPESFNYIDLKFTGVTKDSQLEDALQILVYKNLIENAPVQIKWNKKMSVYAFEKLAEKIVKISISEDQEGINKKSLIMTETDLKAVQQVIIDRDYTPKIQINSSFNTQPSLWDSKQVDILEDVYKTLKKEHYDSSSFDDSELITGAIKGMSDSVWDTYTSYFPPVESNNFLSNLDGEFEWIWAYVDMQTPGELIIVTPIAGSPAEKAGLKWGDRVLKVDDKIIGEENGINEVISWIKWPAGTTVDLTIQREGKSENFVISVVRDTIIIKDIEYSKEGRDTAYIQMKSFGDKVDVEFTEVLKEISEDSSIKKIIFDVRNNPGGYLGKVSYMLGYFVPTGEATAIVNTPNNEVKYESHGKEIIDLNNYEVIILQNTWSASASEIFAGTLKDYYPNLTIIGEQSFGKGSVQTLKTYFDGSTLKYTTAKWYTGKTKTGIDKLWISPDIQLEFDSEMWEKMKRDNQLQKALDI